VKEEKVDTGCQTVPGRDAPPFLVIRRHKNLGKTQAFYGHSESLKNPILVARRFSDTEKREF